MVTVCCLRQNSQMSLFDLEGGATFFSRLKDSSEELEPAPRAGNWLVQGGGRRVLHQAWT